MGLRLGRVKVTWRVDWGLNSTYGQSQMVRPAMGERLRRGGSSKIRMWDGMGFKGKG